MSTVERKEYQETRILRNRSPAGRTIRSSNQNLSEFDSNLGWFNTLHLVSNPKNYVTTDNLLEDLQNSVSRPGSALGHNATSSYKETSKYISSNSDGYGRTNSLNRKAANPVTEYSSDDAYTYKVSSFPSRKLVSKLKSFFSYLGKRCRATKKKSTSTVKVRWNVMWNRKDPECRTVSISWTPFWMIYSK